MKKVVAMAVVVAFTLTYSVAPVFAGGGPGVKSLVKEGPRAGQEKNPKLAAGMSALLPCTGQWYNGELLTLKSAAMAAIEAGGIFVLAFFLTRSGNTKYVAFAGGGVMLANHAWSSWDAYTSAKSINQGLAFEIDKDRAMLSYNIPF